MLEGTVVPNFIVTGANLLNASFSVLRPSKIAITIKSIDPSGTSANLTLNLNATVPGQFVLVAMNPEAVRIRLHRWPTRFTFWTRTPMTMAMDFQTVWRFCSEPIL